MVMQRVILGLIVTMLAFTFVGCGTNTTSVHGEKLNGTWVCPDSDITWFTCKKGVWPIEWKVVMCLEGDIIYGEYHHLSGSYGKIMSDFSFSGYGLRHYKGQIIILDKDKTKYTFERDYTDG